MWESKVDQQLEKLTILVQNPKVDMPGDDFLLEMQEPVLILGRNASTQVEFTVCLCLNGSSRPHKESLFSLFLMFLHLGQVSEEGDMPLLELKCTVLKNALLVCSDPHALQHSRFVGLSIHQVLGKIFDILSPSRFCSFLLVNGECQLSQCTAIFFPSKLWSFLPFMSRNAVRLVLELFASCVRF